jgi:hypothetical protein
MASSRLAVPSHGPISLWGREHLPRGVLVFLLVASASRAFCTADIGVIVVCPWAKVSLCLRNSLFAP